jgi:hypothetical protein
MTWEYYWFRIDMILMLFLLFPLWTIEGIKTKLESEKDNKINVYIMGELR